MAEATFQHVRVTGRKFERASIVLDNIWFENCLFENCDVFYSGGPTGTRSGRFENIRWCFQGSAALTVETMRKLGWQVSARNSSAARSTGWSTAAKSRRRSTR